MIELFCCFSNENPLELHQELLERGRGGANIEERTFSTFVKTKYKN
jgi:hypothetical protein